MLFNSKKGILKMVVNEFIYTYISPFTAAVIITLNVLEVFIITNSGKLKKKTCSILFIFNLTLSDVLVGFSIGLVKVLHYIRTTHYPNDDDLQKGIDIIQFYLLRLSLFASVFNLMTMTLMRWLAVKKPSMYRTILSRHTIRMCILVWLLSIVIVTVTYCALMFNLTSEKFDQFEMLLFAVIVYPATTLFFFSYYSILRNVKERHERLGSYASSIHDDGNAVCKYDSVKDTITTRVSCPTARGSSSEFELRLFKIALRAVIVFIICWFPIATYSIVKATGVFLDWDNMRDLEYCLFTLAFINSIINPLLYFSSMRKTKKRKDLNNCLQVSTIADLSTTKNRTESTFSIQSRI